MTFYGSVRAFSASGRDSKPERIRYGAAAIAGKGSPALNEDKCRVRVFVFLGDVQAPEYTEAVLGLPWVSRSELLSLPILVMLSQMLC